MLIVTMDKLSNVVIRNYSQETFLEEESYILTILFGPYWKLCFSSVVLKLKAVLLYFFTPSNYLVAVHSNLWIYKGNSTEFQECIFKCTAFLAISYICLAKIAYDMTWHPPLLSVVLHVQGWRQTVVIFTVNAQSAKL